MCGVMRGIGLCGLVVTCADGSNCTSNMRMSVVGSAGSVGNERGVAWTPSV